MLKLCAAALAAACLVTPAFAGDACKDATRLLAAVPTTTGKVLADFRVKTNPIYDREIIVGFKSGAESLWFFAKGCLIGPSAVLAPLLEAPEDAPEARPHDPPAEAAPAPKPSGPEFGA